MPMISLQISELLEAELDRIQNELGYGSRSETLRECIAAYVRESQKKNPSEGHQIANIIITHEIRDDIFNLLTVLTRKHDRIIKTICQYNLKNTIIKSLIVAGPATEINDFFKDLSGERLLKATLTYIVLA